VLGNSVGFGRRAAGEEFLNPLRHREGQLPILPWQESGATLAFFRSLAGLQLAFFFGSLQRGFLDQDALPLIAAARSAESHDNCLARTVLSRTPGQGRVSSREVLQIAQARASQTQRLVRLHAQQASLLQFNAALRTARIAQNQERDTFLRPTQALFRCGLLLGMHFGLLCMPTACQSGQ
jgi:hypothetical protein